MVCDGRLNDRGFADFLSGAAWLKISSSIGTKTHGFNDSCKFLPTLASAGVSTLLLDLLAGAPWLSKIEPVGALADPVALMVSTGESLKKT